MSIFRTIYAISTEKISVRLKEKYSFKKKNKDSLYQFIVTAFSVWSLVNYCYLLFFTDNIAFTYNKRLNLHFVRLFHNNCSYLTST